MPDTPTIDRPYDLRGQSADLVAPFCLLRTAALPYSMLEDLQLPETRKAIDRILIAEQTMERWRSTVEDCLFHLVGRLSAEDKKLRNDVLEVRRDAHNSRITRLSDARIADIAERLPEEQRTALWSWTAGQRDLRQARKDLEASLTSEVRTRLRPALWAPLGRENFRRAIGLASPGLSQAIAREQAKVSSSPRPSKVERTLMGYVGRAAAKTSPFSSFMGLSVLRVDPFAEGYPYAIDAACTGRARINRGIISRLRHRALSESARHGGLLLHANPTLAAGNAGRVRALCSREVILLGRPWVEQRWAQFRLDPRLFEALRSEPSPISWRDWCRRLMEAGVAAASVEALMDKFLERGILVTAPAFDTFDQAPEDTLVRQWKESGSRRLLSLGQRLETMTRLADEVSDADGPDRDALVERVRAKERTILEDLGDRGAEDFHNAILEDCWLTGLRNEVLGADLYHSLSTLRGFLSTQVIVSPFYERLRARFVQEYGPGGTCVDSVNFLLRAAEGLVDVPEFGARMKEEPPVSAPRGTRIPVTAQVQIATAPGSEQPLVAVNRVFEGAGWLVARFSNSGGGQQHVLRDQLETWLRLAHAPREPVDLVMAGHCSDLQAHTRLTERVLRWPGEPVLLENHRVIDADTIAITHNTETGLLDVWDDNGAPISLVYLGSTYPSPIWGVRYALSILTQPYLISRPPFRAPEASAGPVVYVPRHTYGNVVLRRATWWVSTEYLRNEWMVPSHSERLLRARRDCLRRGIPDVFYAQRHADLERTSLVPADVLHAYRKPMWIDAGNPFSLDLLERIAEHGDWVCLSEPLPGPSELWMKVDDESHVSELQIEMMIMANEPDSRFEARRKEPN